MVYLPALHRFGTPWFWVILDIYGCFWVILGINGWY